jgi:PAS domain S-box-containing protein
MATNDSAAAAAAVAAAEVAAVVNKASVAKMSPEGMETDGKPAAVNQDAAVGKKRKADATKGANGRGEDDDGYKTDEEQWGGRGGNKGGNAMRPSISSHKGALKVSTQKSDGPPVKQARFSLDQHPSAVTRTDDSQQPLSSLTGSSGTDSASAGPAVTSSNAARTAHQLSSATPATSFHPMGAAGQNTAAPNPVTSAGKRGGGAAAGGKKVSMDMKRREQRNAREKERSCRIANQIDDLRTLLSRGGVIVAKGTKSSVLSEAATYINLLQQQQVQWEIDRQSLIQQMQQIGAAPLHQVLPQNMTVAPTQISAAAVSQPAAELNSISPNDYKFVFNNSSVGMAIASMGGAFVDCNDIFCQLSDYTKEEVCTMTIFNMTARTDLQHAFDLISQMITPPSVEDQQKKSNTIVLRGAMKNRTDLGLSVSLIKGDLGIAKCFCVTLVKILSMETSRPDTVSIEMELPHVETSSKQKSNGFGVFPAYTAG